MIVDCWIFFFGFYALIHSFTFNHQYIFESLLLVTVLFSQKDDNLQLYVKLLKKIHSPGEICTYNSFILDPRSD